MFDNLYVVSVSSRMGTNVYNLTAEVTVTINIPKEVILESSGVILDCGILTFSQFSHLILTTRNLCERYN